MTCGKRKPVKEVAAPEFPYIYRWDRCLGMPVLGGVRKGQLCKVLIRGGRNSCTVEFADGFQAVTSRNALRKAKPEEICQARSPSK